MPKDPIQKHKDDVWNENYRKSVRITDDLLSDARKHLMGYLEQERAAAEKAGIPIVEIKAANVNQLAMKRSAISLLAAWLFSEDKRLKLLQDKDEGGPKMK